MLGQRYEVQGGERTLSAFGVKGIGAAQQPAEAAPTEDLALRLDTQTGGAEAPIGRYVGEEPSPLYLAAKRSLDVLVGLVALLALAPLLLVIAVLVLVDSGWPVFFVQRRVGARPRRRSGRWHWQLQTFPMFKFRTMVTDADSSSLHREFVAAFVSGEQPDGGASDAPFKLSTDPRVTRMGRWLRASSLDELPQLINVVAGSMSLVGPRPVPPYEVAVYDDDSHLERLGGMPGLTGPWQIDGRGVASFEEMVRMDVEYLRAQSLWLDLQLLARTVPCVFSRKGAK